ncbi:uncharacterized protein LOC119269096 [Triticum dicoccoides]|uniref:uncharacterized protein LOC119269096 n=1 Tax=Triticum dicoccoides TaxID=85692 RepID=UPI00188F9001|nr:uncharacterized protein LOC119269096 [Triticum dicoccoides]
MASPSFARTSASSLHRCGSASPAIPRTGPRRRRARPPPSSCSKAKRGTLDPLLRRPASLPLEPDPRQGPARLDPVPTRSPAPCQARSPADLCFHFFEQERSSKSRAASVREEDDRVDSPVDCAASTRVRRVGSKAQLRALRFFLLHQMGRGPWLTSSAPATVGPGCRFGPDVASSGWFQ